MKAAKLQGVALLALLALLVVAVLWLAGKLGDWFGGPGRWPFGLRPFLADDPEGGDSRGGASTGSRTGAGAYPTAYPASAARADIEAACMGKWWDMGDGLSGCYYELPRGESGIITKRAPVSYNDFGPSGPVWV